HLIPFSAFGSDVMLEPARLLGAYLPPLWSTGFNHGYNVDGYYTHCERNGLGGYVQVFRNGIVESAAGDVRDRQQDRDPIIYATSVEDQIATKAHDYLAALQNAGVAPPVLIMVAGGRMAGTTVIGNPVAALPPGSQALPANIRFPTVTLDDFVDLEGCRRALRPVFDAIWNAAGYPRSQSFDAEGKWAPKHS